MAENSIEQIRAAEQKADEVLKAAAAEAKRLVDEARKTAAEQDALAEDAARQKAADGADAAQKAGQAALEQSLQSLEGEMNALKDAARGNQPKAVEMILEALK